MLGNYKKIAMISFQNEVNIRPSGVSNINVNTQFTPSRFLIFVENNTLSLMIDSKKTTRVTAREANFKIDSSGINFDKNTKILSIRPTFSKFAFVVKEIIAIE